MNDFHYLRLIANVPCKIAVLVLILFAGCEPDDPIPVNEEEVITTVEIVLLPEGGGNPVVLRFFDADGELGSTAPEITVSGPLKSSTLYSAEIALKNETVSPPGDLAREISEEAEDHLFCFSVDGEIMIEYADVDANGLPLGLSTSWQTGQAGPAEVTLSLRHQSGTKTGDCPGEGETDVEVTFEVTIE